MDLNDLRLVWAISRAGTLRGAAELMGCSHPTVSRRLDALEGVAGGPVFLRTSDGWHPTDLGERLLDAALRVIDELDAVERSVGSGEGRLAGRITLTVPDLLLTHLLMGDLATFATRYPEVELELLPELEVTHLGQRRPDVALVLVYAGQTPDLTMHRTRVGRVAEAAYARPDRARAHSSTVSATGLHRLGRGRAEPDDPPVSVLSDLPARHIVESTLLRWAAARGGLGPAVLPCFVGESDPELARLTGSTPRVTAELWLLEHPELRRTARVQALGSWLAGALARAAPRLVGAVAGDGPGENLR